MNSASNEILNINSWKSVENVRKFTVCVHHIFNLIEEIVNNIGKVKWWSKPFMCKTNHPWQEKLVWKNWCLVCWDLIVLVGRGKRSSELTFLCCCLALSVSQVGCLWLSYVSIGKTMLTFFVPLIDTWGVLFAWK